MKILTVAVQKGGEGKTFLTCNLAWYLSEVCQKRVLVVDLDSQANATYTLSKSADTFVLDLTSADLYDGTFAAKVNTDKNAKITLLKSHRSLVDLEKRNIGDLIKTLKVSLDVLSSKFDYCIVDSAPSISNTLTTFLCESDFVIAPIAMEDYSILGVENLIKIILNIKKVNNKLIFLGLVPNKVEMKKPRIKSNYETVLKRYKNYVFPAKLSLRDSFAEAQSLSVPVWKMKKTAAREAAREIKSLCELIYQKI